MRATTDSDTSEPVEFSSLIQAMVQLLKVSVPGATTLNMNLSKDPTPIWANAGQIRQVVLNLIVNASEALEARAGNRYRIHCESAGEPRLCRIGTLPI